MKKLILSGALLISAALPAMAQEVLKKQPIKIVYRVNPRGAADAVACVPAESLQSRLG